MSKGRPLALLLLLVAAPAAARELTVVAGATVTVIAPGATAAYAVDALTVEATAVGGQVVLVGRRLGQTLVNVVTPAGVESIVVRVDAPTARALGATAQAGHAEGFWEGRYESGTGRLSSSLDVAASGGERSARVRVYGLTERDRGTKGTLRAIPSASLELVEAGRSLVLLDELVESSPLTVDDVVLRGLHLSQGPWALHAGISSATPWNQLLLAADGDRALELSYRTSGAPLAGMVLVPMLLWLPDAGTRVPAVASLGMRRGGGDDPLQVRAELGWSGRPGGSLDLSYRSARQHGWLSGAYRPIGFAALGVARPAGSVLDGAWSAELGARSTADFSLSATDVDLIGHRQRAGSTRLDLRTVLGHGFSVQTGAGLGGYRSLDRGGASVVRRLLALGGAWDAAHFGAAALYRYQDSSTATRAGNGGRLSLRGSRGGFRGSLFVDAQQEAPTLGLLLRSAPGLDAALAELGLEASTPDEVVRLLRDNAALLAAHGVSVGALELQPLRVQSGVDLAWRGGGSRRPQLGLRVTSDASRGGIGTRAWLATLSATARVFGDTDLTLGWTRWSTPALVGGAHGAAEVALRTHLDDADLHPFGGRSIRGSVARDDAGRGELASALPLGGVEVVLDSQRRTRTDSNGRFRFEPVSAGNHRVQVVLPPAPGAFFTTPSVASLAAGGEARFAISFSAARLAGRVHDDAGQPLAGVTVQLTGPTAATVTTDSQGVFVLASAAGEARVAVVADSLPAGYELAALAPITVRLVAAAPATVDFTIAAQRTVTGTVAAADPRRITVTAQETGRSVVPGADGRFIMRGVPQGRLTLVAHGVGVEGRRVVVLPAGPGTVDGGILRPR